MEAVRKGGERRKDQDRRGGGKGWGGVGNGKEGAGKGVWLRSDQKWDKKSVNRFYASPKATEGKLLWKNLSFSEHWQRKSIRKRMKVIV